MIEQALAGRRIAVTGSTGFLGTAVVERLLRSVPECSLVLLVRSGRRISAQQRVQREILRNDAFDKLREILGDGFDEAMARRITVISGDVSTDDLGLDEGGARHSPHATSSSTQPQRCRSTPPSTTPSR